jgi:WD40 repeat protein
MKRRTIFLIIGVLVLAMGLAACGDDDDGGSWATTPDKTDPAFTIPAFEPITAANAAQVSLWKTILEEKSAQCGNTRYPAWSTDGTVLAFVSDKSICLYWLLYPESEARKLNLSADAHKAVFSPDGKTMAAGSGQGKYELRLYDLETGKVKHKFKADQWDVDDITFSPDGSQVAALLGDDIVHVWTVADGKEVHKLTHDNASSVAFSPDGTILASGSWQHIILWNADTGEQLADLPADVHEPWDLLFSPDGATLAAWGGINGQTTLWDVESGELLHTLIGPQRGMRSGAFTLDGSALLLSYDNHSIVIWDVATGEQIVELEDTGENAALSPDGTLIVATEDDAAVTLWAVQAPTE